MKKLFISLMVFNPVFAHSSDSLCGPDEMIIFSCLVGKKIISYCASADLDANRGYMQYRFGTKKKVELVFPNRKTNAFPIQNFEVTYFTPLMDDNTRAHFWQIKFKIRQFTYDLTYNTDADTAALDVERDGRLLARLSCKSESIQTDHFHEMHKLR